MYDDPAQRDQDERKNAPGMLDVFDPVILLSPSHHPHPALAPLAPLGLDNKFPLTSLSIPGTTPPFHHPAVPGSTTSTRTVARSFSLSATSPRSIHVFSFSRGTRMRTPPSPGAAADEILGGGEGVVGGGGDRERGAVKQPSC